MREVRTWRDKDDFEMTSEDIDAMANDGVDVEITGPPLPGGAVIVEPAPSFSTPDDPATMPLTVSGVGVLTRA